MDRIVVGASEFPCPTNGLLTKAFNGTSIVFDCFAKEEQLLCPSINLDYQGTIINLFRTKPLRNNGVLRLCDGIIFVVSLTNGITPEIARRVKLAAELKVKVLLHIEGFSCIIGQPETWPSDDEDDTLEERKIYNPSGIYASLNSIIHEFNEISELKVDPREGTVSFGEAAEGWALRLTDIPVNPICQLSREAFIDHIWGNHWWDGQMTKWRDTPSKHWQRGFDRFVLPYATDAKEQFPADQTFLRMISSHIPRVTDAQKLRLNAFCSPDDAIAVSAISDCNPEGPLIMLVSHIVRREEGLNYVYGRILSGTAKVGMECDVPPERKVTIVKTLTTELDPIEEIECGMCAVVVCDGLIPPDATTLTSVPSLRPLHSARIGMDRVSTIRVTDHHCIENPTLPQELERCARFDPDIVPLFFLPTRYIICSPMNFDGRDFLRRFGKVTNIKVRPEAEYLNRRCVPSTTSSSITRSVDDNQVTIVCEVVQDFEHLTALYGSENVLFVDPEDLNIFINDTQVDTQLIKDVCTQAADTTIHFVGEGKGKHRRACFRLKQWSVPKKRTDKEDLLRLVKKCLREAFLDTKPKVYHPRIVMTFDVPHRTYKDSFWVVEDEGGAVESEVERPGNIIHVTFHIMPQDLRAVLDRSRKWEAMEIVRSSWSKVSTRMLLYCGRTKF